MKAQTFILKVKGYLGFFLAVFFATIIIACQPFEAAEEPVRGNMLVSDAELSSVESDGTTQGFSEYLTARLYADTLLSDFGITAWNQNGSVINATTSHNNLPNFSVEWQAQSNGVRLYTFKAGQSIYLVSVKLALDPNNPDGNAVEVLYSNANQNQPSEVYINNTQPVAAFETGQLPSLGTFFSALAFNTELSLQLRSRAPQLVTGYNPGLTNHLHVDGTGASAIEEYYVQHLLNRIGNKSKGLSLIVTANTQF